MSRTFSVELATPAHEMAQEEIQKQVAFLTKGIANIRFSGEGSLLEFDAPDGSSEVLADQARELSLKVQRGLRSLHRKVAYRTPACDGVRFRGHGLDPGVISMGIGQVALEGLPLSLFRYFDRVTQNFGHPWQARDLLTPTLIPAATLAKCDYFRSFPQNVTFACHIGEDADTIAAFRDRHKDRDDLEPEALASMQTPEACLSPAVCYHVYAMNRNRVIPATGLAYNVSGKCFRYESTNMRDLRRLWDFTMRETVFLGSREDVLSRRDRSTEMMKTFLDTHRLAAEIRTASDPFFIAPDAMAKTYFQLSSETKFEVSLLLPDDQRLAVGSLNYHSDFFGRAFSVGVEGAGAMHSVCVAFGLERLVYAFLEQHGNDPVAWPETVRNAPEFAHGSR